MDGGFWWRSVRERAQDALPEELRVPAPSSADRQAGSPDGTCSGARASLGRLWNRRLERGLSRRPTGRARPAATHRAAFPRDASAQAPVLASLTAPTKCPGGSQFQADTLGVGCCGSKPGAKRLTVVSGVRVTQAPLVKEEMGSPGTFQGVSGLRRAKW